MGSPIISRAELQDLAPALWSKHRVCRAELAELLALSYLPATQENGARIFACMLIVARAVAEKPKLSVVPSTGDSRAFRP